MKEEQQIQQERGGGISADGLLAIFELIRRIGTNNLDNWAGTEEFQVGTETSE